VTYQITRGTASYYRGHPDFPDEPWMVEKVLCPGEAYTIATFVERADAEACWNSLRPSMEVGRGATLTESA
jgi:hypothetical protein